MTSSPTVETSRHNRLPRPFLVIWAGQTVSEIGSMLTSVAVAVFVFIETGSAIWLGALSALTAAPTIAVAWFAPFIDRRGRRVSMLLADLLAATAPATLILLAAAGHLDVWHLAVGGMVSGFGTALQLAASQAALPSLVPGEAFDRANGLRQLGPAASMVIGPAAATPLLIHGGIELVLLVDLATFLVGFTAVALTRFAETAPATPEDDGSRRAAWIWLRDHDPALLTLMAATAVINLAFAFFNVGMLATAITTVGPARMGTIVSIGGAAMIAGSLVAGARPAGPDRIRTLAMGLGVAAVGCAVAASRPAGLAIGLGVAITLAFIPMVNAAMATIYNDRVPTRMQGRVFALRGAVGQLLQPVGSLAAGIVIAEVASPALDADGPLTSLLRALIGGGPERGSALILLAVALVLASLGWAMAGSQIRSELGAEASGRR